MNLLLLLCRMRIGVMSLFVWVIMFRWLNVIGLFVLLRCVVSGCWRVFIVNLGSGVLMLIICVWNCSMVCQLMIGDLRMIFVMWLWRLELMVVCREIVLFIDYFIRSICFVLWWRVQVIVVFILCYFEVFSVQVFVLVCGVLLLLWQEIMRFGRLVVCRMGIVCRYFVCVVFWLCIWIIQVVDEVGKYQVGYGFVGELISMFFQCRWSLFGDEQQQLLNEVVLLMCVFGLIWVSSLCCMVWVFVVSIVFSLMQLQVLVVKSLYWLGSFVLRVCFSLMVCVLVLMERILVLVM